MNKHNDQLSISLLAPHRGKHKGDGFKSHTDLNFFSGLILTTA